MRKFFYFLILASGLSQFAFGQLAGVKTIPGDYASVAAAISALNAAGVGAGGVTFNIAPGYTETFSTLNAGLITTTGTSANPIVFKKNGAGTNPLITAATPGAGTADFIFCLAGTDYLTFDGINIQENAANTTPTTQMEWGYAVLKASATDGSQNIVIKNCTITLNKANTATFGIYSNNHTAASTTQLTVTAASGTNSTNKFFSNAITNSYGGIYLNGYADGVSPYSYYDQNNEIGVDGANTITNFGGVAATAAYGITTTYQKGARIANNSVSGGTGTTGAVYGISSGTATSANVDIFNNTVTVSCGGTTAAMYGIYNSAGSTATTNIVNIYNNTVQNCTYATSTSATIGLLYNAASAFTVNLYGNIILNCSFPSTGTLYGIYSGGAATNLNLYSNEVGFLTKTVSGTIYAIYGGTSIISVHDNNVHHLSALAGGNAIYGFYDLSSPTNENYYNNIFNNFSNSGTGGVFGIYTNTATGTRNVYLNTIYAFNAIGGGPVYGIYGASSAPNIYRNRIYDLTSGAVGGLIYGIYLISAVGNTNIYNNFISDLKTPAATGLAAIAGIYISGGTNVGVYYNTIYMNASSTGSTFGTMGIYASTTPTVDIRNNIVVNLSTAAGAGGYTAAYRRSTSTLTTYAAASNNNDFYAGTPGAANVIYYDGTTAQQTMAAYKTLVSPRDAQSFTENPPFVNVAATPYDLHLKTTVQTQCESGGAVVSSPIAITTDFDNQARYPNAGYPNNLASPATAPDLGADEFGGLTLDLIPPAVTLTPLANTSLTIARTLTTSITDATGVPTTGTGLPRLYWKINAGSWQTAIATYVSGSTYTFSYGAGVVLGDVVSYYIVAQDIVSPTPNIGATPGAGAAGFTINPPAASTAPTTPYTYTIVGSLCGTYQVGVGKTYATLTAAITDLNGKEVTCPVTFVLTDANYSTSETFPIVINSISGGSSVNTVTIKPATGVTPLITGSGNPGIIILNGCDYVIIDGSNAGGTDKSLTIQNTYTGGTAATVMWFNDGTGATNNTLKNCIIKGGSNTITTIYGVFLNFAGGFFDNTTIQNNTILNAYIGLQFVGVSGGTTTGGSVIQNTFGSIVDAESIGNIGISMSYVDGVTFANNNLINFKQGSNPKGIVVGTNSFNTVINANNITGMVYTGTSGYGGKGIDINTGSATSNLTITNNTISNLLGDGWSTLSSDAIIGIRVLGATGGINLWFNSINLSGIASRTSATVSSGLYFVGTATNLNVRDNVVANSINNPGAVSKAYAIYSDAANTAFTSINYNDYFGSGAQGVLGYLGTDQINLAGWQTATAQDANSISMDPVFTSGTDLHASAAGLAKTGIFIASVPADFSGAGRTNPPDMGAYQFSANPAVVTLAANAITASSATLNGTINANSAAVTSGYEYGLTTAYGSSIAGSPGTVSGTTVTPFTGAVSGLAGGTLYHFRAKGVSGGVTVYGNDLTFTTLAVPPTVVTLAATGVTTTAATLNGTVNANGFSTTVSFDYGLTVSYGTTVPGVPVTITGSTVTPSLASLTGLIPNTTYHFRINGTSVGGTVNGSDLTFTTAAAPPTVTTTAATLIGTTTATLNGIVNANNSSTAVSFEYGLTVAYGTTVPGVPTPVTGSANTNVSAAITGLVTNTTYHFRVKGTNGTGTSNGLDLTFLTGCPQPAAAAAVTGPVNVCLNGTGYVYTVPAIANATTYNWTLPNGATITAGANTNSITVSFSGTAVSGNISVFGSSVCGSGTASPNLAVTVNPQPVPTVTGPSSLCQGSTGNVYTTQAGMTGYTWTLSGGGVIIAGLGTNAITVLWNTAGAQTVCVNYTNANGCSAATPGCYNVTVNALPVPTITGPASACVNSTGNVYTTEAGMTNYIWTVSAGGTIISGSTSNILTVTWATTGAKTVCVNYTNANGCTAAAAVCYNVTVNALPTPTITGPATACQGSAGNVYTTQTGMSNYVWTVAAGGTITAGGTSTSNTVTVTWTTSGAKTVAVNYTSTSGCTGAAAVSYAVTVNPTPVPTIGSTNNPCVGSTNNIYYTESGMTGYVWTVSAGGTIVSGQGTSTLNVTWTVLGTQTVSVTYTNSAGCPAIAPGIYTVFVNSPPNAAGAITGTASVCAGANGVAYSTAPIVGADTYFWTVPSGATIASGNGTTSITVNYGTAAVSGNVTVAGTNQCGNGVASNFAVTVNPLPAAAGTITGPSSVCAGATGVAYSVPTITSATAYVWTVPVGAVITAGSTTKNIVVTFGPTAGPGIITVKGTNTCGSGTVSPNFNVTMNAVPAAPVITIAGNVLTSSASTGNQWYYQGNAIAGATGQSYTVTNNTGYYSCVVTLNGCSSPVSNQIWVVVTGVQEVQGSNFSIYPVPNDGRFTVSITSPVQETYSIMVYNQVGAKIYELKDVQVNGTFEKQVDLRPVASGVYSVVFLNSEHKVVRKVLVNK